MYALGDGGNAAIASSASARSAPAATKPAKIIRAPIVSVAEPGGAPYCVECTPRSSTGLITLRERRGGGTFDGMSVDANGVNRYIVSIQQHRERRAAGTTFPVLLLPHVESGTTVLQLLPLKMQADVREVATDAITDGRDDRQRRSTKHKGDRQVARSANWLDSDSESFNDEEGDDDLDEGALAEKRRRAKAVRAAAKRSSWLYDGEEESAEPPTKKEKTETPTSKADLDDLPNVVATAVQRYRGTNATFKVVFTDVVQALDAYPAIKAETDQQKKLGWFKMVKTECTKHLRLCGCTVSSETVHFPYPRVSHNCFLCPSATHLVLYLF